MSKSDKKEEKPFSENHDQRVNENNNDSKESPEDKLKSIEDKLLRALAEMENQRRRFEKEREEAFEFGGFNFAKESLSLIDNIDRAIESFKSDEKLKNSSDLDKVIDGIEIVKKDLISIFKKNGIEHINCINKKFDPNYHQAMLEIEDPNKETGIVVQEIQKGYMMKDRLLRPSLVGVTKKKEEKADKTTKDNKVFDLCRRIIEDGKLTEDEVYDLSNFINKQTDECDDVSDRWPTSLLIKPLQEGWHDGVLDSNYEVTIHNNLSCQSIKKVKDNFFQ